MFPFRLNPQSQIKENCKLFISSCEEGLGRQEPIQMDWILTAGRGSLWGAVRIREEYFLNARNPGYCLKYIQQSWFQYTTQGETEGERRCSHTSSRHRRDKTPEPTTPGTAPGLLVCHAVAYRENKLPWSKWTSLLMPPNPSVCNKW